MKVEYRYSKIRKAYNSIFKVVSEPIVFCCEEMKDAWNRSSNDGKVWFRFYSDEYQYAYYGSRKKVVEPEDRVFGIGMFHLEPQYYGETSVENEMVKYCPFCGEKFEL